MNRPRNPPPRMPHSRAYRRAFQRLDESLERTSQSFNAERLGRLRLRLFAEVDELEKSGEVKLPP